MAPGPQPFATRAVAAVALLALGLVCGALYRIVGGTEQHAYAPSAQPPGGVHVTTGKNYQLSVPGGVAALRKRGVELATLQCEWSSAGSAKQVLPVTAEGADTKASNVVATFTGPITGGIDVDCFGLGAMFVDDADDSPADVAGWFLVTCLVALTIGAGLALSALRSAQPDPDGELGRTARQDEEIQRLVDIVHVRSQDGEVGGVDRGDVTP